MALSGATVANRVLGQVDFTHNGINIVDARGSNTPSSLAIDISVSPNRIYVADTANNRVLGWSNVGAFATGGPADLVIGQPDFSSAVCASGGVKATTLCAPTAVTVDNAGNLYVADTNDNRVLEYNTPYNVTSVPGSGDAIADLVFGQTGFTNARCNQGLNAPSAVTLCNPKAVGIDNLGNLYIADTINNRVLEYNTPLAVTTVTGSGDTTADFVFGQPGMASAACNLGVASASAGSLCGPRGVAADASGNVYISDTNNHRVLEYNTPLKTTSVVGSGDATADQVLGQATLFLNACDAGGESANTLCAPAGLAVDGIGNLFVADTNNRRVIEYNTPLTSTGVSGSGDTTADFVFGQRGNFNWSFCNLNGTTPSNDSLCLPLGVGVDSSSNVYIADTGNNRILEYNSPLTVTSTPGSGDSNADGVLGQLDYTHVGPNIVSAQGMNSPLAVAIDLTVTPNHVYVADSSNNRVLGWVNAASFVNGNPADMVIGQPDSISSQAVNGGVGPSSYNYPEGVTVDSLGNLYVADTYNNRVLEYNTPYVTTAVPGSGDTVPDAVFGQPDFHSGQCNQSPAYPPPSPTPNDLCFPVGVQVDQKGNVYISDAYNCRILEYNTPFTVTGTPGSGDTTADLAIGQANLFTATCNTNGVGSSPTASSLSTPEGIALDTQGNLYIADHDNSRVLEYNTPLTVTSVPGSGDTYPDLLFGQPSYTASGCKTGPSGLCTPRGVLADSAGNLYVSDSFNHRLLEYNTPLVQTAVTGSGDTIADMVFGQRGNFSGSLCDIAVGVGPTADDLCRPSGLALDSAANLYAADSLNHRVLEFNQPIPIPTSSATATPSASPTPTPPATATPSPTATATPSPTATATPSPTATATPSPTATATPSPTATATPSPTATPTPSPTATATASATPTRSPSATPTPSPTVAPTASATPSPTPTTIPTPSVSPTQTPTPASTPVAISTTVIGFGGQVTNTSSSPRAITLTNNQSTSLNVSSIGISGANAVDFSQTNNCGNTVAANKTCNISVVFTPSSPGSRTAVISINDDASNSPQTVQLVGQGLLPAALTPGSAILGPTAVGSTSAPTTFTLTNNQNGAISIKSLSLGGSNAGDFALTSNCGSSLSAHSSCTISVTFSPIVNAVRNATLTVSDNAANSPQTAGLSGVPPATFTPASLGFPTTTVNTTSAPMTVLLRNFQKVPLNLTSLSMTGQNPGDFGQTNNCPTSIPASGSCTFSVTFTPSASGARTAILKVVDNAPGGGSQTSQFFGSGQ